MRLGKIKNGKNPVELLLDDRVGMIPHINWFPRFVETQTISVCASHDPKEPKSRILHTMEDCLPAIRCRRKLVRIKLDAKTKKCGWRRDLRNAGETDSDGAWIR